MKKVITYGTFDRLHHGHINLLKRAKELGDYLIVGVTSNDFDQARGKLLVQQSVSERVEAVRNTGLADQIIVEEYEGQKIADIEKYGVDVFVIGSDWRGKFDYLEDACGCKVVYLPRTRGISSTKVRGHGTDIRLGVVGSATAIAKFFEAAGQVGGTTLVGYYNDLKNINPALEPLPCPAYESLESLIQDVDVVYVHSSPLARYRHSKLALTRGKHVLCESPVSLTAEQTAELYRLAEEYGVLFSEAIKTAHTTGFQRLGLLLKGGHIGEIKGLDAVCTSLQVKDPWSDYSNQGGGAMTCWGPYVLLAALKYLGYDYQDISFYTYAQHAGGVDRFTRIQMTYPTAVATLTVGSAVKSEGHLIISGTNGYIYVPSPWWKTDYFEVRQEDSRNNRRHFYPLEGEGYGNELADFIRQLRDEETCDPLMITRQDSTHISAIMEQFRRGDNVYYLS